MSTGKTFYTESVAYGSTPQWDKNKVVDSMKGEVDDNGNPLYPVLNERDDYEFISWQPVIDKVVGNQTYTATYKFVGDLFVNYLRDKEYGRVIHPSFTICDNTLTTVPNTKDYFDSSPSASLAYGTWADSYIFKNYRGIDEPLVGSETTNFIFNPCGGYYGSKTLRNIVHNIEIDIPNFQAYPVASGKAYGTLIHVNRFMNKQDEKEPGITTYAGQVLDFLSYDKDHQVSSVSQLTVNPQCKRLIAYNTNFYGCLYTGVGPEELFMPYLEMDKKTVYKNTWNNYSPSVLYSYAFPNTIKIWWAGNIDQISEHYLLRMKDDDGNKVNSLEDLILTRTTNITEYNITAANAAYDIPYDATVWVPNSMLSFYLADSKWNRVVQAGLKIRAFDAPDTPQRILDMCVEVEHMKARQKAYRCIDVVAKEMGRDKQEEIYMKRDWLKWCAGKGNKPDWCNTSNGTEISEAEKYPYPDFYWDIPRPDSEEAKASISPPEIHRYFTNTLTNEDKLKHLSMKLYTTTNTLNKNYRQDTSYACEGLTEVTFNNPPCFQFDSLKIFNDITLKFPVDFSQTVIDSQKQPITLQLSQPAVVTFDFCNNNTMRKFMTYYRDSIVNIMSRNSTYLSDVVFKIDGQTLTTIDLVDGVYQYAGASSFITDVLLPSDITEWPTGLLAYSNVRLNIPTNTTTVNKNVLKGTTQEWNGIINLKTYSSAYYDFAINLRGNLTYKNVGTYNSIYAYTKVENGYTVTYDGFNNTQIQDNGSTGTVRIQNASTIIFNEKNAALDIDDINVIHNSSPGTSLFVNGYDNSKGLSVNGQKYIDLKIPDSVVVPKNASATSGYNKFAFSNIETISDWGGVERLGQYNFCYTKLKGMLHIPPQVFGFIKTSSSHKYNNFDHCPDLRGVIFDEGKTYCEAANASSSGGYKFSGINSQHPEGFDIDLPTTCTEIQNRFIRVGTGTNDGILTIICRRYMPNDPEPITKLTVGDAITYTTPSTNKLKVYVPDEAIDLYKTQWNSVKTNVYKLPDSVFQLLSEYVRPD